MQQAAYPVQFSVDYPDRALNRVSSAFRIFAAIPILIVLGTVAGGTWQWSYETGGGTAVAAVSSIVAVFLPIAVLVFLVGFAAFAVWGLLRRLRSSAAASASNGSPHLRR